jgi:hypothetical protein
VNDNDVVIDYGRSPLATVQSLIASGYNTSAWNGTGGITSASQRPLRLLPETAIGYAEATDLFTTFPATFSGRSVDSTSILIRYTAAGDANLNGSVDTVDFNARPPISDLSRQAMDARRFHTTARWNGRLQRAGKQFPDAGSRRGFDSIQLVPEPSIALAMGFGAISRIRRRIRARGKC